MNIADADEAHLTAIEANKIKPEVFLQCVLIVNCNQIFSLFILYSCMMTSKLVDV